MKGHLGILIASLVWVSIITGGAMTIFRFETTSGDPGVPPPHWPVASELRLDGQEPTLVVFIHPRCPCSRATLEELSQLMTRRQGHVATDIVIYRSPELPTDWEKSDLWQTCRQLPGVKVSVDSTGRETRLFDARTSGQCYLYDPAGELMFAGGITDGRGHIGDNEGLAALYAATSHHVAHVSHSPVYGCPIALAGEPVATGGKPCCR